ncbi:MAG: mechanosensitive ion channel family protein [Firmicutes bacterium]|nr:mechanosensitive ion channel family protein [Bacillota bacterium]
MLQALSQLNISQAAIEDFLMDLTLVWGSRIFKSILIILLARLALRFGHSLIQRILTNSSEKPSLLPEGKAQTLRILMLSVWRYAVYAFTALLLLSNLDIEIGPILAGAGVVGLAVGFGAQNLVRDVISGFFIILEDQFSVGDYITALGNSGIVEEIGLRTTSIRGFDGEIYILPNGLIETVTNWSRGHMRALVEVGVAYEEDVEHVLAVLEEIVSDYATTDPDVVEGPTVLGIMALADSAIVIRIVAMTVSMAQWKVERNIRRAIKNRFDELDIEIPYPRRVYFNRGNDKEDNDRG